MIFSYLSWDDEEEYQAWLQIQHHNLDAQSERFRRKSFDTKLSFGTVLMH